MSNIIVALDELPRTEALALAERLAGHVAGFKVHSLVDHHGFALCEQLAPFGLVMVDLKLHDIPNTMAYRASAYADVAAYLTVHAGNTSEAIRAAVDAVPNARIAAVTLLTSINQQDCQSLYKSSVDETVAYLAHHAVNAGAKAIVCSGRELKILKAIPKFADTDFLIPGVRSGADTEDQRRTVTPREAIRSGAQYIIIGREITRSDDPLAKVREISAACTSL